MNTPNDKDHILALLIDRMNRQEAVQPPTDDPLAVCLFWYREQYNETGVDAELWESINRKTKPEAGITPIYSFLRLAAAAILVIAVIYGVFRLTDAPPPAVYTAETSNTEILLADGTAVLLRAHSSLQQTKAGSSAWKLSGEAWFDVSHDPDRVFEVSTIDGLIRVMGTSFNVSTWTGQTRIFLSDGSVEITSTEAGIPLLMEPGQSAFVHQNGEIEVTDEIYVPDITGWKQNQLIFTSREFGSILAEISHHFNIMVQAPDALMNQRLSGTIFLTGESQTLDDLGIVLNGKFKKTSERTYVFEWHE
jgi:transmembrane sensor